MNLGKIIDPKSVKTMAVATFYYASGAIFGPLLLFGGLGYLSDKWFSSSPLGLIIGVFLAFVTTNFLLLKKLGKINRLIASYAPKPIDEVKIDQEKDDRQPAIDSSAADKARAAKQQ
ncbi:TPA: hypothetical protein DCZ15_01905 [Candidatus Falkowbacteria bacterium]|nr:hypothetical protein [Candidatus Falkowbacteria bacterium]